MRDHAQRTLCAGGPFEMRRKAAVDVDNSSPKLLPRITNLITREVALIGAHAIGMGREGLDHRLGHSVQAEEQEVSKISFKLRSSHITSVQ